MRISAYQYSFLFLFFLSFEFSTGDSEFNPECVSGKYPPKQKSKIPEFKINLDLPPEQRWNDLAKAKADQLRGLLNVFKTFLYSFGNESKVLWYLINHDLGWVADTLPSQYGKEIKGIANSTGINTGEVVLFNIFYEIFTVCTSVITEDSNGTLYHARNLDFGLFMGWNVTSHQWMVTEALKDMIVMLDFQQGGKTSFKTVSFVGYIGVITGMKPGLFSLTMNERFSLTDGGYIGLIEWLLFGEHDSNWVGFIMRDTLAQETSYAAAKDRLSHSRLLAPCYFILGGNSSGQGSVITRARANTVDVMSLNVSAGRWYVLETNYDHWVSPPFYDDRRTPAMHCMDKKTQPKMGFSSLFNMLSSRPVLNKLTVYTALMQVNQGRLETYLQDCPDPCWPW